MGWEIRQTHTQKLLEFSFKELAINYARKKIDFELIEPKKRKLLKNLMQIIS